MGGVFLFFLRGWYGSEKGGRGAFGFCIHRTFLVRCGPKLVLSQSQPGDRLLGQIFFGVMGHRKVGAH